MPNQQPLIQGLLTAARTFSAITGTAGFGLLCGLAYGAWLASNSIPDRDPFAWLAWPLCLAINGTIGFSAGLAVGLLVLLMVWILRLAKGIAGRIEQPPAKSDREKEIQGRLKAFAQAITPPIV